MNSIITHLNPVAYLALVSMLAGIAQAQVAIKAESVYTMSQAGKIEDGVVIITNGKVAAIGKAADITIPDGYKVIEGKVAVPGLIDGRGTIGTSGMLNQRQDQDQIERSGPVQPELRAIDAFNPQDSLVAWVRSLGVTTVHTGHAPGELISGQTALIKTTGKPVEESVVSSFVTVASTLGPQANRGGNSAPGTRAKMVAMLREEFIRTRTYVEQRNKTTSETSAVAPGPTPSDLKSSTLPQQPDPSARDLRLESLALVLDRKVPLLITVNYAQDISSALRLAAEFNIKIILDSASEAYMLIDEIKAAKIPVIIHPTMYRGYGEMQNMSMETCSKLLHAGIPVVMQSGYETYVPKSRVVLFEAAIAAANGCTFEEALSTVTTQPATVLGVADRIGSLKAGMDGDVAVFDGDPFEYTTHCTAVIINGEIYPGR